VSSADTSINVPKDFPTIRATVGGAIRSDHPHRNRHRHQIAVAMADIVKFTRLT